MKVTGKRSSNSCSCYNLSVLTFYCHFEWCKVSAKGSVVVQLTNWCNANPTPAGRVTLPWKVYMAKSDSDWLGYLIWPIRQPVSAGHPHLSSKSDQIKGPLPTLMHCAPRTQFSRISCNTKLLIVVKGFFKDLISVQTAQTIRSRKIAIRSNGSGYPLEKEMSSLRTTQAIRLNGSGYPLEKNVIRWNSSGYPFKTIVSRATSPNHFHSSRRRRTCQKM